MTPTEIAATLFVTVSIPLLLIARGVFRLSAAIDRQTDALLIGAVSDGEDGPDGDDGEPIPEQGSNVVAIGRRG